MKLRGGGGGFLAPCNYYTLLSQLSPSFCSYATLGSSVSDSASPTVGPPQARGTERDGRNGCFSFLELSRLGLELGKSSGDRIR
ncbi:hypothetical protein SAY87_000866 [Trapa incisa]|uniref:Uncharacterized protein n=1 Tax=Trapa incisa TaxID=236973 RepID=A0AAN7GCB6_9MYRT|nr:hypothetical protein SAY87_000866 [Trapa incisa]